MTLAKEEAWRPRGPKPMDGGACDAATTPLKIRPAAGSCATAPMLDAVTATENETTHPVLGESR